MTPPLPWTIPGRLQGVDVSSSQATLPWQAIAAAGVVTASVKASEAMWNDARFAAHLAGARSVGLYTDSYHFLHSTKDGTKQGETYTRQLEADGGLIGRPTLDWEDTARVKLCGPRIALDNALAFLRTVHKLTGRRPNLYTGPEFMKLFAGQLDLYELAEYDLWVAHYRWHPVTGQDYGLEAPIVPKPWQHAMAWQASGDHGPRIPGVSVDIDRDVLFFPDVAAYLAWCADVPVKEPNVVLGDEGPALPLGWQDRAEQGRDGDPAADPTEPTS